MSQQGYEHTKQFLKEYIQKSKGEFRLDASLTSQTIREVSPSRETYPIPDDDVTDGFDGLLRLETSDLDLSLSGTLDNSDVSEFDRSQLGLAATEKHSDHVASAASLSDTREHVTSARAAPPSIHYNDHSSSSHERMTSASLHHVDMHSKPKFSHGCAPEQQRQSPDTARVTSVVVPDAQAPSPAATLDELIRSDSIRFIDDTFDDCDDTFGDVSNCHVSEATVHNNSVFAKDLPVYNEAALAKDYSNNSALNAQHNHVEPLLNGCVSSGRDVIAQESLVRTTTTTPRQVRSVVHTHNQWRQSVSSSDADVSIMTSLPTGAHRDRTATTSSSTSSKSSGTTALRSSLMSTGSFSQKDKFRFLVSPQCKDAEVLHPIVKRYLSQEPIKSVDDDTVLGTNKFHHQMRTSQKSATVPSQLNRMQMKTKLSRDDQQRMKSYNAIDSYVAANRDAICRRSSSDSNPSRRSSTLTHSSIETTV